jgi:hypothetical protein
VSRVILLGGRGFIGKRIHNLLRKALPDAPVLLAGRGPSADGYLHLDRANPDGSALKPGDVLINTVGPFTYDATPLVNAVRGAGCHWVDLAETPAFMQRVRELAKQPGPVAITGCSSVPGLIEVYAQRWAGDTRLKAIRAQLSIGTNNPASSTLLFSMLDPIGRQGIFGRTWMRNHTGLSPRRYGTYPSGLERDGLLGVPVTFGFGFDRPLYTLGLRVFAPVVGLTPRLLLKLQSKVGAFVSPIARPLGTKIGILSIDALDAEGQAFDSVEIRAYNDGLDVPCWPSVWAAEALLNGAITDTASLAGLITPDQATAKLRAAGFEVLAAANPPVAN